ncbi:unnamed protein product [Linum trigynum]|uniref:Uncharacterized protein n=1 Tax=Linum trigynum TaxID=586398 RepID=A0AAV2DBX9_9ROSI
MEISAEELAESMFFTRCLIDEKVCLVLVDGGRERNLISSRTVVKLGLQSQLHPAPYNVQLPYEKYPSFVISQVVVDFSISSYKDRVLCDVVYNLPSNIFFGQPWFHDRQVRLVSRRSKKFRLQKQNNVVILVPLSPEEAAEDLKTLQSLQEEYRKALLEKPLTLKGDPVKALAGTGHPCSALTKQRTRSEEVVTMMKVESGDAKDTVDLLEVVGMTEDDSKHTIAAQNDPCVAAQKELCFAAEKQSVQEPN